MATTIPHGVPTLQHAIADLTGYEDADTLRWQPPCTSAQDRDPGSDGLAHGRDLTPCGAEPFLPPDTAPPATHTSLQAGPAAADPPESGPAPTTRKRAGRAPRGPAPTGSAARWPTSEAPASMNVKLKVGNMELMYTARDTNDQDLQDRMTTVLPWLAEVMAACEVTYDARQQAAAQPTPPPPPAPAPEHTLEEQGAATVQAAMPAQATASPNGAGPAAEGRRTPPPTPASERTNDRDPSWCAIHTCAMEQHSNAHGTWWSHYLGTDAHGKRRYCKGE